MKNFLKFGCLSVIAIVAIVFIVGIFASDSEYSSSETKSVTTETGETKPEVEILQTSDEFEPYSESYTIHVRVKNNGDKLIKYLQLNGTWFDKEGKIVGTGMGNTTNFASGAEKTVDVMGMDIQEADRYEIQIENVMY